MMAKIKVVIETPRGSNAKYAYDPDRKAFVLRHVLPEGMTLPYDFGFVPGTLADDGDPLDAIAISELTSPPGIEMECRVVAAITAEQHEADDEPMVRNDRLLVVPCGTRAFAKVRDLEELPAKLVGDIEDFFVHYHAVVGHTFKPLERLNAKGAERLIEKYRHE
jgi:inorganic pyrophosphatase